MDDKKMLAQFARETMGSSVAHMSDEELDAWMEPWRRITAHMVDEEAPGFPQWFINRRDEARVQLLSVLRARLAAGAACPSRCDGA